MFCSDKIIDGGFPTELCSKPLSAVLICHLALDEDFYQIVMEFYVLIDPGDSVPYFYSTQGF